MASRPERGRGHRAAAWTAHRIADGRFDVFSAAGAMLVGGRWNSPGVGVIYASATFAGAMLECLAHAGIGRIPATHVSIEIRIPGSVPVEERSADELPEGWDGVDLAVSRSFGNEWIQQRRSAVLVVPSVVARKERNVLFNPQHAAFSSITAGPAEPVIWDARLFQ